MKIASISRRGPSDIQNKASKMDVCEVRVVTRPGRMGYFSRLLNDFDRGTLSTVTYFPCNSAHGPSMVLVHPYALGDPLVSN